MIAGKFLNLETSATGTEFVAFADVKCHALNVLNLTGTSLTFQYVNDDDETDFVLPHGMAYAFRGLNNANQLKVKRTDESDAQVTIKTVEATL